MGWRVAATAAAAAAATSVVVVVVVVDAAADSGDVMVSCCVAAMLISAALVPATVTARKRRGDRETSITAKEAQKTRTNQVKSTVRRPTHKTMKQHEEATTETNLNETT